MSNRRFGKCPLCGEDVSEKVTAEGCSSCYGLDQHIRHDHGIDIEVSEHSCAWCGVRLSGIINHYDRHRIWFDHLSQCGAYAAWALSGAQVWKN